MLAAEITLPADFARLDEDSRPSTGRTSRLANPGGF